jgi:hypothetical protein
VRDDDASPPAPAPAREEPLREIHDGRLRFALRELRDGLVRAPSGHVAERHLTELRAAVRQREQRSTDVLPAWRVRLAGAVARLMAATTLKVLAGATAAAAATSGLAAAGHLPDQVGQIVVGVVKGGEAQVPEVDHLDRDAATPPATTSTRAAAADRPQPRTRSAEVPRTTARTSASGIERTRDPRSSGRRAGPDEARSPSVQAATDATTPASSPPPEATRVTAPEPPTDLVRTPDAKSDRPQTDGTADCPLPGESGSTRPGGPGSTPAASEGPGARTEEPIGHPDEGTRSSRRVEEDGKPPADSPGGCADTGADPSEAAQDEDEDGDVAEGTATAGPAGALPHPRPGPWHGLR